MANEAGKQKYYAIGIFAYLFAILGGLFAIVGRSELPIFAFHFNAYALISLAGIIAVTTVIILLVKHRVESQEHMWMLMALSGMLVYAVGELLQRLSVYPASAVFWSQVTGTGAYFISAGLFLFVIYYTRPSFPKNILAVCILVSIGLLTFFDAATSVVFRVEPQYIHLFPWGYNNDVGAGFPLHALWTIGLPIVALVMLRRFRNRTANPLLKTQATLFFYAMLAPVFGALVFDAILPTLHAEFFPPLASLFATITGVLMTIGILRYRFFELSPELVSQNILSTMNEAVIVTNANLEIEFTNAEAGNLLQVDTEKLIKQPLANYLNNDGQMHEAFRALLQNKHPSLVPPPIEDITIQRNGKLEHTRILTSPIVEAKQVVGYIFVISDVTELKQAYSDLEEAKTGVEHTVEVRTRELRNAQKKLLETDKLKSEFIMLTSHNLRTPLSIINGYTSALKTTELDESQRHILENLDISAQRLGKLINNLLTISVIESREDQLSRHPINASKLLWDVVGEADTTAKGNGNDNKFIRTISVGDSVVNASPERLKATLGNILENAFKFTKQGEVTFTANVEDDKLVIKTKDTGIGIKSDELPKLFTKFHRGTDTLEFGYEGEGIGLYLSKLVIDEHEGTIKVESKEGVGTLVTITLPITHDVDSTKHTTKKTPPAS